MVYCTKCGADNSDDAVTCKNCAAPLNPPPYKEYRSRNKFEDDACFGRSYMWSVFIGLFLLLLGVSSLMGDTIAWMRFDKLWPLLIIVIALSILYSAFTKRNN